MIVPPSTAAAVTTTSPRDAALRKAASELEAAFLAEMLKAAGLGQSRSAYGGGAGEDQFAGLLVRVQAEELARTGGIGLAESLFHALKEHEDETETSNDPHRLPE